MALKDKSKGARAKKAAAKGASAASDWASPRLGSAKELAFTKAGEARDWAAPRLETAVDTVNAEVVPRVQSVVNQATEAAGPTLHEAKSRGSRAVAALRGADVPPPPKKKRRVRKTLLILLGVAVAGGAAAAVWSRRNADGFDYYSLPADDFGHSENTNGTAGKHAPATERADADPGQPAMPNTDPDN
ncbi:MAG: hypothetical protein GEV07_09580 [Streptosporangiales bacterium]|nr:hypothetical protein [Streptosporangiales bacterium]